MIVQLRVFPKLPLSLHHHIVGLHRIICVLSRIHCMPTYAWLKQQQIMSVVDSIKVSMGTLCSVQGFHSHGGGNPKTGQAEGLP